MFNHRYVPPCYNSWYPFHKRNLTEEASKWNNCILWDSLTHYNNKILLICGHLHACKMYESLHQNDIYKTNYLFKDTHYLNLVQHFQLF